VTACDRGGWKKQLSVSILLYSVPFSSFTLSLLFSLEIFVMGEKPDYGDEQLGGTWGEEAQIERPQLRKEKVKDEDSTPQREVKYRIISGRERAEAGGLHISHGILLWSRDQQKKKEERKIS